MMAIARPQAVAMSASATPPVMLPAATPMSPVPRAPKVLHHARDRSEQTEEGSGGDARIERGHTLLEAGELLARGANERVRWRKSAGWSEL